MEACGHRSVRIEPTIHGAEEEVCAVAGADLGVGETIGERRETAEVGNGDTAGFCAVNGVVVRGHRPGQARKMQELRARAVIDLRFLAPEKNRCICAPIQRELAIGDIAQQARRVAPGQGGTETMEAAGTLLERRGIMGIGLYDI